MTPRRPSLRKTFLAFGRVPGRRVLDSGLSRLALIAVLLTLGLVVGRLVSAQSPLDGFNQGGVGVDDVVNALAVQADGKILIGGPFTAVFDVTRNYLARLNADGTLDTGFNANFSLAVEGGINAIAVQTDGKLLVGGKFNTIAGQTRNFIARLNADGTLDTGFNPNADDSVFALTVQTDGKLLVGGDFTNIGGQARNHIARLNTDGTLDTGFNPNADGPVYALAVQNDGKLLAGGDFTNIGGQTRNSIARLNTDGTLDSGFNPNADGPIYALAVQADGKLLVGGQFEMIGGQLRSSIARLNTDGTLDSSFNPNAGGGAIYALVVQADGRILVGGEFETLGGQSYNNLARLKADGTIDIGFSPNFDGAVFALAAQADGRVLAGGIFTAIGGQTRNHLARLYDNGTVEVDSNPNASAEVFALAVQADGKILVGGEFNSISELPRNHLARLNADGSLDTSFNQYLDGNVFAIAVQADGKILVGGEFTSISEMPRNRIARFNADGTLDTSFNPNADESVQSLALQADGKILVGGNFTTLGGQPRNRIARLNADGSLDTGFNSDADSDVHALVVQTDGKILVGGFFTSLGGQPRNRIGRLNADGSLDTGFNPDANENVDALALQADGKILAGGNFTSIGGQPRNHLARLNVNGTLDTGFDPNVDSVVYALAIQADGRVLAGGSFASVGGQTRNAIARLNADGSLDTGFDPNADSVVFAMTIQADGKVLVGGLFTGVGGQARNRIARLTNTAALQTLSANAAGTTITWSRSGTSPEINRVTFEQSTTFGESWSSLGNGSRVGTTANWQLTGLALPTSQNLLLRARGYQTTGGFGGGDPSVYESVRLVYLSPTNTAPGFPTVATLERQQGSAASNSTIASVSDTETAAGSLSVTTLSVPSGITVTNIVNTGGTITADVAAGCTATGNNTVVLQVSDGSLMATANLTVNVAANTPPGLSYNNASVLAGDSTMITPPRPGDNGSVTSIVLLSQGSYTGTISVNNLDGAVSINNAAPVGTHTITIRATDNCGATTDASFMLTVQACSYSISPAVASFSASGGNGSVAVTTASVCAWSVVNNAPTWITLNSGGSGTGNGTVSYTVAPNVATNPRSGTLTIAGQTFVVTQIAAGTIVMGDFTGGIPPAWVVGDGGTPAVYDNTGTALTWTTLNPCNRTIPPPFAGPFAIMDASCTIPSATLDEELRLPPFDATGLGSVFVEFYSQFKWDAAAPNNKGDLDVSTDGGVTWINALRLENGNDGVPTPVLKTVNITPYITANPTNVLVRLHYYGVSPNSGSNFSGQRRAADLEVYWGVDFGVYAYNLTPGSQSFSASGGSGAIVVSASSAFPSPQGEWTATSNVPWITITGGATTRGNGTVNYSVAANAGGLRTGTLTVSGRSFTVTQSCVPSPAGLIAWYSAEDNANDRQGNNHGTLHNSANFATGFVGKAFNLDGVNDYVQTTLDAQPAALPNMTWEAWVYPTRVNHSTRQSIFSTDDGGFDRAVTIEAASADFGVFTGAGVWRPVAATPNQWQHIAVVYTPTGIEFYKDGVKYIFAGAPTGQATANRFHIGRNPAAGEYFAGLVDEVGVYNRALIQAEIQNVVNASSAGRCGVCTTVTLNPASLPGGAIGSNYGPATVSATPGGSYSFAVTSGTLPNGLMLNPSTGALTGTPTASGTFSFVIAASSGGCVGSRSYSITIGCVALNPGSPLPTGQAGVSYAQTISTTPAGSYTFSLVAGNLPNGLTLNPTTGVLSGTPAVTGTYTFTVKAQAANGCNATQAYTLVIGCPTVAINPAALPAGTKGMAYNQALTATPAGGNYTYAVTNGSLPPGLNLNPSTGNLSGTPTANGNFSFTITATGWGGCTGNRSYTIVVGGGCPTITLPASLPNGTVGQLYSNSVAASPAGSYSYAVTTGSLPPGLALFGAFGLVYGYPTAAGSYTFTITATDGNNCTGSQAYTVVIGGASLAKAGDFDGDGKADVAVFRASQGNWLVIQSSNDALQTQVWGAPGDQPVAGDYDGDGKLDLAVFTTSGHWRIKRSSDGTVVDKLWGLATDVPVPGDYDGDGKTDLAVWRGSEGNWYIINSSNGVIQVVMWGAAYAPYNDVAVPGDYDGDHKTDLAVFRQQDGAWYIKRSSDSTIQTKAWGLGTDVPVPGDYDGDGKTDIAVWRGQTSTWFIIRSGSGLLQMATWGASYEPYNDVPVPGDYDGDGKTDIAVWRPAQGMWYSLNSSDGQARARQHGQQGDKPVTAKPR